MFLWSNLSEEDLIRRASSEIESWFIDAFILQANLKFPWHEDEVERCIRHQEKPWKNLPKWLKNLIENFDKVKEEKCRSCFAPLGENYYTYRWVTNEKVHVCERCYIENIIKSALNTAIWDIQGVLSNIYKRKSKNEIKDLSKSE